MSILVILTYIAHSTYIDFLDRILIGVILSSINCYANRWYNSHFFCWNSYISKHQITAKSVAMVKRWLSMSAWVWKMEFVTLSHLWIKRFNFSYFLIGTAAAVAHRFQFYYEKLVNMCCTPNWKFFGCQHFIGTMFCNNFADSLHLVEVEMWECVRFCIN